MRRLAAPLTLEALASLREGRGEFRVLDPFTYETAAGETIVVPAGFRTDLCSVPALLRPFVPLSGPLAKPALLHDWLLDQGDDRAHAIFGETLELAGVAAWKRWLLVAAVKLWASTSRLRALL